MTPERASYLGHLSQQKHPWPKEHFRNMGRKSARLRGYPKAKLDIVLRARALIECWKYSVKEAAAVVGLHVETLRRALKR